MLNITENKRVIKNQIFYSTILSKKLLIKIILVFISFLYKIIKEILTIVCFIYIITIIYSLYSNGLGFLIPITFKILSFKYKYSNNLKRNFNLNIIEKHTNKSITIKVESIKFHPGIKKHEFLLDKKLIEYKNRIEVEVEEDVISFENYIRVLIEENAQQIKKIENILNNWESIS